MGAEEVGVEDECSVNAVPTGAESFVGAVADGGDGRTAEGAAAVVSAGSILEDCGGDCVEGGDERSLIVTER